MTTVAITRAGSGLGGWGYHTWAGFVHQGKGKGAQLLLLSLGFSLEWPQIAQAEASGARCALFLLKERGFLGCSADIGNNRKSVGNCSVFHFSQYCPDDVFLVLIRLFKAQFLWISHHCEKIGLTVLWPVHSQILPVASFSVNSLGHSSCGWREGLGLLHWKGGWKSGWDWFQPTLVKLTVSWHLRPLKEVCKETGWWSKSLFFWDAREVTAASFCLAALGLKAQGLLFWVCY